MGIGIRVLERILRETAALAVFLAHRTRRSSGCLLELLRPNEWASVEDRRSAQRGLLVVGCIALRSPNIVRRNVSKPGRGGGGRGITEK